MSAQSVTNCWQGTFEEYRLFGTDLHAHLVMVSAQQTLFRPYQYGFMRIIKMNFKVTYLKQKKAKVTHGNVYGLNIFFLFLLFRFVLFVFVFALCTIMYIHSFFRSMIFTKFPLRKRSYITQTAPVNSEHTNMPLSRMFG